MPGAWEKAAPAGAQPSGAKELKPGSVAICIPLGSREVHFEWTLSLVRQIRSMTRPYDILNAIGMPVDVARNALVKAALEQGYEWLAWLDSVPGHTPVLTRDAMTQEIDVLPIEDIVDSTPNGSLERIRTENLETLGGTGGWTNVHHLIRHPYSGPLVRVDAVGGCVDASPNHSLFTKGRPTNAGELKPGTLLARFANRFDWSMTHKNRFFRGGTEVAWLLGLFVAEGSVSSRGGDVSLANSDTSLLDRASRIFSTHFNLDCSFIEGTPKYENCKPVHKIEVSSQRAGRYFSRICYTKSRAKRIPKSILNGPDNIRKAFFDGYMLGDGHRRRGSQPIYSTNSHTLAAGLTLLHRLWGESFSVHRRYDKPTIVAVSVNKSYESGENHPRSKNKGEVKRVASIRYSGTLYDLATADHGFAGGIGPLRLHNSDVVPNDAKWIDRLIAHGRPIVSGIYIGKKHEGWFPCAYKLLSNGKFAPLSGKQPEGLVEVDVVGAGLMMTHRSVFEKMKPPWFLWTKETYNEDGTPRTAGHITSEDFFMNLRARKELGIPTLVDTTVRGDHIGWMKLVATDDPKPMLTSP